MREKQDAMLHVASWPSWVGVYAEEMGCLCVKRAFCTYVQSDACEGTCQGFYIFVTSSTICP